LRDLTERDANEIIGTLYMAAIDSDKITDPKGKSFSVQVLSSDAPRAIAALRSVGLPRAPRPSINEVFKSTGFAPTPFEERVRFAYGNSQEIERTLSLMDGVLQARAHLVIPEGAKRGQTLAEAKASIFISYDDRYNLELSAPKIRRLVADSIEGLSANNVEVLFSATKLDMKKISSVPLTNFLGMRIHSDDFAWFVGLFAILFASVAVLGVMQLYPFLRKHAQWL
jgi:type III secretion protein J